MGDFDLLRLWLLTVPLEVLRTHLSF
uniref:Uncharacterized protein n=1 Tax=Anguilla anguilla TaxID=7936 RepID=A0A0E9PHM2_ANGAN